MSRGVRAAVAPAILVGDEKPTEIYYWWLLVAIFFEYARPMAFIPGMAAAGKLNSLIPLALFFAVLFARGLRPFERIFSDKYARWILIFLGLVLLSIPFADVTYYSFDVFKKVFGYFLLFVIIARVATSKRRLRGIFVTLVVAHLFLILMNPDIVLNHQVRSYIQGGSFLGDGNDFGLSLCILVPMAIELAVGARSRVRAGLAWTALGIILLAIVGTQSRGATLALGAVLAFLWLISKRKVASLVGMLFVCAILAMVVSQVYFARLATIKNYQQDGSATGRIMVWKAGVRMAIDHPVTGVGAGHFPIAFGNRYKPPEIGPVAWLTAHSMYFLVLGELGLPGIVTYSALIFGGMTSTMAARRRLLMSSAKDPPPHDLVQSARLLYLLTASVLAFAVAGAFLSVTYYPHVFVLSGILLAARQVTELPSKVAGVSGFVRGRSGVHGLRQRTVRKRQARGTQF